MGQMRTRSIKLLCLLVLVAYVPFARAQAAQPVYRCIGAHGEPVFSGQPCGTPAPVPATSTLVQGSASRAVCAGSPQALRQAIADAFARHDVNRLSGLILWNGMDQNAARTTLHELSIWLQQPLTGIAVATATGPPGADTAPLTPSTDESADASGGAALPPGFDVSTGGIDGTTRDFGLVESGGCWWLTF